ncbi:MAG: hypothetical protein K2H29_00225 [Oscillospiraceae bacterium]|nr:hypothetical protein [Oscillospiraceae bacterium]
MSKQFESEIIRAALELSAKKALTCNVRVEHRKSSNNYKISVWKKGVAAGIISTADKWADTVKTFENYCSDLKKSVNAMDIKAHVTLMLLNDTNLNRTLLMVVDGTTIHDFMQKR